MYGNDNIFINTVNTLNTFSILLSECIASESNWDMNIGNCDSICVVIPEIDRDIKEWDGVKRHRIKRYQRKLRALHNESDISFIEIKSRSQLVDEFPSVKELHISRWKAKGEKSKYSDPKRLSFIFDVCEKALQENALFFPIMKIDGILASFIIGFKYGDTIFDWNTAFSLEFYEHSPGALLLLHVLSNPGKYGFLKYNLMKGLEPYKFIWTDKVENNLSVNLELS